MAKVNKYLTAEEPVVENVVIEETPVVEEPAKKPVRSSKKAPKKGKVVKCALLNVREKASTNSDVIKCLAVDTEIDILGEEGDFYKIADGFVMKSFIEC